MLTRDHILALCPRAKEEYVSALTDPEWGIGMMQRYGILENHARLAGFLANGFHETGGLTIISESLNYKSTARLRQVWPGRFAKLSDQELQPLCGNELGLACAVYNGRRDDGKDRMGNRAGSDDGFTYRGKGLLQVTGRDSYVELSKLLGLDPDNGAQFEDMRVMTALSCAEWWHSGCNELCDAGNFDGASAKINTGSERNVSGCVGLEDRRRWHSKIVAWLTQNPDAAQGEPAALVEGMHPDGDTVPGQTVHFTEMEHA